MHGTTTIQYISQIMGLYSYGAWAYKSIRVSGGRVTFAIWGRHTRLSGLPCIRYGKQRRLLDHIDDELRTLAQAECIYIKANITHLDCTPNRFPCHTSSHAFTDLSNWNYTFGRRARSVQCALNSFLIIRCFSTGSRECRDGLEVCRFA